MTTLEHPPSARAAESHSHAFKSSESTDLQALLRRAGFRIRNSKRADCPHCSGASQGTVTSQIAQSDCHIQLPPIILVLPAG